MVKSIGLLRRIKNHSYKHGHLVTKAKERMIYIFLIVSNSQNEIKTRSKNSLKYQ